MTPILERSWLRNTTVHCDFDRDPVTFRIACRSCTPAHHHQITLHQVHITSHQTTAHGSTPPSDQTRSDQITSHHHQITPRQIPSDPIAPHRRSDHMQVIDIGTPSDRITSTSNRTTSKHQITTTALYIRQDHITSHHISSEQPASHGPLKKSNLHHTEPSGRTAYITQIV